MVKLMRLAEEIMQDRLNEQYASMSPEEFFSTVHPEPVSVELEEVSDKIREIVSENSEEQ